MHDILYILKAFKIVPIYFCFPWYSLWHCIQPPFADQVSQMSQQIYQNSTPLGFKSWFTFLLYYNLFSYVFTYICVTRLNIEERKKEGKLYRLSTKLEKKILLQSWKRVLQTPSVKQGGKFWLHQELNLILKRPPN